MFWVDIFGQHWLMVVVGWCIWTTFADDCCCLRYLINIGWSMVVFGWNIWTVLTYGCCWLTYLNNIGQWLFWLAYFVMVICCLLTYRISGIFLVGLIFAEFATSLKSPKIDTAKNKPYYTSSLRVLEITKIGLSENLTHLPSVNFAKISRSEKSPI